MYAAFCVPANVVEGHPDILEAEVVEGDHADKHYGEGEHLLHHLGIKLKLRERDLTKSKKIRVLWPLH